MNRNTTPILDILICAGKDSKAEYIGATETKLLTKHTFQTKSKSSCAKTVTLFADILTSRRVCGVSVTIENLNVIVAEVKKLWV